MMYVSVTVIDFSGVIVTGQLTGEKVNNKP